MQNTMKAICIKFGLLIVFLASMLMGYSQPCVEDHVLSDTLFTSPPDMGFKASDSLSSTQFLSSGISVDYKAGSIIILSPGFTAEAGVTFSASIAGCNVGIEEVYAERFAIANYPNPFQEQTQIIYYLDAPSNVNLYLTDVMGRPVADLVNSKRQGIGEHKVNFSAKNLSPGIYLYILEANDQKICGRMLLQAN